MALWAEKRRGSVERASGRRKGGETGLVRWEHKYRAFCERKLSLSVLNCRAERDEVYTRRRGHRCRGAIQFCISSPDGVSLISYGNRVRQPGRRQSLFGYNLPSADRFLSSVRRFSSRILCIREASGPDHVRFITFGMFRD
ncbi:hypothetical protein GWI33_010441 [Rhynchophorus ferrugineus]|uniref:Uncharacterized protein n=1 Tax=Rhynchophorus ferrugineus TaxID=354439 RepID=A0A834ILS5_RHYFE|nr:hypothetical protein GWI33_010441 [Rhynchophorus ferrugineus]